MQMTSGEEYLHSTLDSWWQSKPDPALWDEVLEPLKGRAEADTWIHRRLQGRGQREQALFRQWRALHCWTEFPQTALLVGWPVSVQQKGRVPGKLSAELAGGLSHALLPQQVTVTAAQLPVPANALHATPTKTLQAWLRDGVASSTSEDGDLAENGPYVWVSRIRFESSADASELEQFFHANKSLADRVRPLAMRAEALLEEQGVRARVFPPTALWNAASMARLMDARLRLSQHARRRTHLAFEPTSSETWALKDSNGSELERFSFPEELPADVMPLGSLLSK